MTSIGDWQCLSADMPAIVGQTNHNEYNTFDSGRICERFPEFQFYIDRIWGDNINNWLPPIGLDALNYPDDMWYWHYNAAPDMSYREPHPSPCQYAAWLNTHLRPTLGMGDPLPEQGVWLAAIQERYVASAGNKQMFSDADHYNTSSTGYVPPINIWPPTYRGF
jgi:hypothetical protein